MGRGPASVIHRSFLSPYYVGPGHPLGAFFCGRRYQVEWEPPKSTKARRIAANRLRDNSLALNELQAFAMSLFVAP